MGFYCNVVASSRQKQGLDCHALLRKARNDRKQGWLIILRIMDCFAYARNDRKKSFAGYAMMIEEY